MFSKSKKFSLFCALLLTIASSMLLPLSSSPALAQEVPVIKMAWGFDLHAGILLVATARGEKFKDGGVYLKPITPIVKSS